MATKKASPSSLPFLSCFTEGAKGLERHQSSQEYRMEDDKGTGIVDGTFVREICCEETADCGTRTLEEQGPSV